MKSVSTTLVILLSFFVVLGCASSPEPQFHTLVPNRGALVHSEPLRIELRRPELPGYLERPQLVRREGAARLDLYHAHHWGAPLEDMVATTLAENLSLRLSNSAVFSETGAVSATPDVVVEVSIQRFEATDAGAVELAAQVALHWRHGGRTIPERYTFRQALSDSKASHIVVKMSLLLARLADVIATSIASSVEQRTAERAGAAPAP